MLLNKIKITIFSFSILLVLLSFNCQANVLIVSCPATFSDGYDVYLFKNARVFDGTIVLNVELKPEFEKNKQFYRCLG